jgi:hypothetical protein
MLYFYFTVVLLIFKERIDINLETYHDDFLSFLGLDDIIHRTGFGGMPFSQTSV